MSKTSLKIKKDDLVLVITGKDKGKQGKVLEVFGATKRVIVEGVNVNKRHQRPKKANQQGQIIDKTLPIHVSNVQLIDPKDGGVTRIGKKVVKGKNVRVALKSGTELET